MPIIATASIFTENDKKKNLETFTKYIKEAAANNADVIVFPELALQGLTPSMLVVDPENKQYQHINAEVVPEGESTQYLLDLAKQYDMYICWGMTEQDRDRNDVLYNSAVLVGPEGYVGTYRKVHNPLTERLYVFPGNDYPVFDTKLGKIGLMVCFDIAFPEVARCLALNGAEMILCPTGWPAPTGKEDDDQLFLYNVYSSARAIENCVYLVTSTLSGEYNGCICAGHSRITGPMPQEVLAETSFEEGLAIAEVDIQKGLAFARLNAMMTSNLMKDRRPDTYGAITKATKYNCVFGNDPEYNKGE